ncbi:MAG: hypothetical protein QG671_1600 [Actinomycetota bacterium]|jgi:DNA-binding MarR family transcriptional regulator|nr:hypothetical protein [Actinomycetota bacterium]
MGERAELESAIADGVRALSAASDRIGKAFAGAHSLSANDFRALLHVMVAEQAGSPLSAGELRDLMGVSGAAITYLVERMIESGHLRRESDPTDRRKVILKYADHGLELGRQFFTPLEQHTRRALVGLSDRDLRAAHRVLVGVLEAMREFETDLDVP